MRLSFHPVLGVVWVRIWFLHVGDWRCPSLQLKESQFDQWLSASVSMFDWWLRWAYFMIMALTLLRMGKLWPPIDPLFEPISSFVCRIQPVHPHGTLRGFLLSVRFQLCSEAILQFCNSLARFLSCLHCVHHRAWWTPLMCPLGFLSVMLTTIIYRSRWHRCPSKRRSLESQYVTRVLEGNVACAHCRFIHHLQLSLHSLILCG